MLIEVGAVDVLLFGKVVLEAVSVDGSGSECRSIRGRSSQSGVRSVRRVKRGKEERASLPILDVIEEWHTVSATRAHAIHIKPDDGSRSGQAAVVAHGEQPVIFWRISLKDFAAAEEAHDPRRSFESIEHCPEERRERE